MTTEISFLNAIRANPDDMNLRLVFADWLEEQGHPKAELFRLSLHVVEIDPSDRAVIPVHDPQRAGNGGAMVNIKKRESINKRQEEF